MRDLNGLAGNARPLEPSHIETAAAEIKLETALVRAVAEHESAGRSGFRIVDGAARPIILFEKHIFGKLTNYAYNATHPDLSSVEWSGGYGRYDDQYKKLERAMNIDPPITAEAALKACSWGLFQVLGVNCKPLGYVGIEEFVRDMMDGEDKHLESFRRFIDWKGADEDLRDHDFARFAYKYNGKGYKKNNYDAAIEKLYLHFSGRMSSFPALRRGDFDDRVLFAQKCLNELGHSVGEADGDFGRNTEKSVKAYQAAVDLPPSGRVDLVTWEKLTDGRAAPETAMLRVAGLAAGRSTRRGFSLFG